MSDLTRREVITIATNSGHTVGKAIQIALDYERDDPFVKQWVALLQANAKRKAGAQ